MEIHKRIAPNRVSGEVVAVDVTAEEYLEKYAAHHCEWVNGVVIRVSPVNQRHDRIIQYLIMLLRAYFSLKPIGRLRHQPFVMRLPELNIQREPDIQIILNENLENLKPTYMDGPADICIEVVSAESVSRDHGEKYEEYERGRVGEYWIIDPIHQECRFYQSGKENVYVLRSADDQGYYESPKLPGLKLYVPDLWNEEEPDYFVIGEFVKATLSRDH